MSLIKEYLELTKKYSEEFGELTIILMQNGAFFEVYALKDEDDNFHSSRIVDFSRMCDLNIVDKKASGDKNVIIDNNKVVNAGFKTHLIEKYIKKLQDNGYTAVVYQEDEEDDPITKKKNRSLTGVYSPGTFFSSDPELITNNTCCIWMEVKKPSLRNSTNHIYIGVSQLDIYTGTCSITEYNEIYINNPTTFDELERFISIYRPSETIIVSNLSSQELSNIVSYINLQSKSIHYVSLTSSNDKNNSTNKNAQRVLNCEKQVYQYQLLNKFYKIADINSFMSIFNENVYACQSFCYLLDFIFQHNPYLIYKISEPILESTNKKLILANHSLKQLNIIDDDNYKGKYSSVVKMLNECITAMGKRKFSYIFLNPITDETELQREYDITEYLLDKEESYNVIKSLLTNIKDISKINRQIILKKVNPKSLYQLYDGICKSKQLYNMIKEDSVLVAYLKYKIKNFDRLINDINSVLDYINSVLFIEECKDIDIIQKTEKSFIKSGVNDELDHQIKTLFESKDQLECCRAYFDSIISNYETSGLKIKKTTKKKKQEELEELEEDSKSYVKTYETETHNFSLLATERRCKILSEILTKGKSKNIILRYKSSYFGTENQFTLDIGTDPIQFSKQSAANHNIFNKQIKELCKNVSTIKVTFIETLNKVYNSIIHSLEEYNEKIEMVCDLLTYTDVVFSKALIANKYNYCKPEIVKTENEKSFIKAENLRHCLIEKIQQSELYVSNDVTIGDSIQDGILLYGTNAVGKTSLIRAIGIAQTMAQAGLYVPATRYSYHPYKYIFTRILGNDNLFKGLSTFAVEMSELRTILRLADKNSLVLGDELCSGTESISAVSIFVSGVQALHKVGCSFIFATHLHEIINYDEIVSLHSVALKHMSVVYDKEKDCLIYNRKLQDGPGNNMYGLEVCKSLNLPQDFLENAHNIRMKYHPQSASLLEQKPSHFNAHHISGGMCEKCGNRLAVDVHHLIFQNEANEKGVIKKSGLVFNKNTKANLINLCEECHNEIHKTNKKYKKSKSTKGTILQEIS